MKGKFFLLLCLPLLNGCLFSPVKDISRFYTMRDQHNFSFVFDNIEKNKKTIISVNLEGIPAYADLPYIVSLKNSNEIIHSKISRWSEPLHDTVARISKNEIQKQLGSDYIVVTSPFSSTRGIKIDYKISIKISDFIFNERTQRVEIKAFWTLYNAHNDVVQDMGEVFLTEGVGKNDTKDIVEGMQRALSSMVQNISYILTKEKHITSFEYNNTSAELFSGISITQGSEQTVSDVALDIFNDKSNTHAKIVHLSASEPVYVVMSGANGERLFSGYLKAGEEKIIPCKGPYEIKSSNDNFLFIKEN